MHFHNTAGFIYFFFSWIEIKSLNFPRESSASMLDKDGNINKSEFLTALESMRINLSKSE